MKKDMKQDEKRRQNNKGFSLVELIVVIAIMAVLVAVAAPQFTKYVDRSRQSVDATTVAGVVSAAQVGVADVIDYSNIKNGTYVFTFNKTDGLQITPGSGTGITTPDDDAVADMQEAVISACGALENLKPTAKAWDSIVIDVKVDGNVTVDYKTAAFKEYLVKAGALGEESTGGGSTT